MARSKAPTQSFGTWLPGNQLYFIFLQNRVYHQTVYITQNYTKSLWHLLWSTLYFWDVSCCGIPIKNESNLTELSAARQQEHMTHLFCFSSLLYTGSLDHFKWDAFISGGHRMFGDCLLCVIVLWITVQYYWRLVTPVQRLLDVVHV